MRAYTGLVLDRTYFEELGRQYGTPLCVYDAERLNQRMSRILEALAPLSASIHYFEPANRNRAVLARMLRLGLAVCVTTIAGVRRSLDVGFTPELIQCSGFGLCDADLCLLEQFGVSVNLGSVAELKRFAALACQGRFGVRLDLGDTEDKRGIFPAEAGRVLQEHRLQPAGLHTYLGTNCLSAERHARVLEDFCAALAMIPPAVLARLEYINVGGGFGYDYRTRKAFDWDGYARAAAPHLAALHRAVGKPLALRMEVGRAAIVDSGYLLVRIVHALEKRGRRYVVVDANLSHFGRPARYGFDRRYYPFLDEGYHQIELLGAPDGHIETAVVGNSHYSKDWFGFARLPHFEAEQLVGAYMIIYDVGAYGESMSDPWADIPRPAAVMVEGESHWLVTERETLQELAEDRRQRRHDQAASLAQAPPLPGYRDI